MASVGTLLATTLWFSAFSEIANTNNEKCRLVIIGPGSRGQLLMDFLVKKSKVDIVALCDIYKPSIEKALKLTSNTKVHGDYRKILEDKTIDAVFGHYPS